MIYRYKHGTRPKYSPLRALFYIPGILAGILIGFVLGCHVIYWILASTVIAAHG